jgi:hypothetical protein
MTEAVRLPLLTLKVPAPSMPPVVDPPPAPVPVPLPTPTMLVPAEKLLVPALVREAKL